MKDGFVKVAAAAPVIRVADAEYNAGRVIEWIRAAHAQGVKVLAFPELTLTGVSCYDLYGHRVVLEGAKKALARVAKGRRILAVELDAGQFADDVRLNLAKSGLGEEAASVRMLHRMGGEVVAVDAVLAEVEKMMKG